MLNYSLYLYRREKFGGIYARLSLPAGPLAPIEKMIDVQSGQIRFNNKLTVTPNLDITKADAMTDGLTKEYSDMRTGWEWLRLKNIKSDKTNFFVALGFDKKKLKVVNFTLVSTQHDQDTDSEYNWTIERERMLQKELDKWLTNEIGIQRTFAWGQIGAYLDEKACSSSIVVTFNENK